MPDFTGADADGIHINVAYPGSDIFYEVNDEYDVADQPETYGLVLGDISSTGFVMEGSLTDIRDALLRALRRVNDAVRDTTQDLPAAERVRRNAELRRMAADSFNAQKCAALAARLAQVLSNLKGFESKAWAERAGFSHPVGEVDRSRLNVMGGSVSIGHPFGATGARIITTLVLFGTDRYRNDPAHTRLA